jgi:hypothetical protein
MQLHYSGDELRPQGRAAPPAAPGPAGRGVPCQLGGHVDTGSGRTSAVGRSAEACLAIE